jgi:hypothetical protein
MHRARAWMFRRILFLSGIQAFLRNRSVTDWKEKFQLKVLHALKTGDKTQNGDQLENDYINFY